MNLLDLPPESFYVARCFCHEWVLVKRAVPASCGECGARPEYLSEFDGRTDWGRRRG